MMEVVTGNRHLTDSLQGGVGVSQGSLHEEGEVRTTDITARVQHAKDTCGKTLHERIIKWWEGSMLEQEYVGA